MTSWILRNSKTLSLQRTRQKVIQKYFHVDIKQDTTRRMGGCVRKNWCHALFIVGIDVAVDSTEVLGVAMEKQKRIVVEQQNISNCC